MHKEEVGVDTKRRNFLKLASASIPAAAISVTVGTEAAAAEISVDSSGLQDTAHTRAYLESARF